MSRGRTRKPAAAPEASALRLETWRDAKGVHVIAATLVGRAAHACALAVGPDGRDWRYAEAWLRPEAFCAGRDALMRALPFAPATRDQALMFCDGRRSLSLAARLTIATRTFSPAFDLRVPRQASIVPVNEGPETPFPGILVAPASEGYPDPTGRDRFQPAGRGGALLRVDDPRPDPDARTIPLEPPPYLIGPQAGMARCALAGAALEPLARFLEGCVDAEIRDALGERHWSPGLQDFLLDPSNGRYRRQAMALHPWAIPLISSDAALRALVDGGRPFEAALGARIAAWSARLSARPPGPGTLRSLRSLRAPETFRDLVRLLEAAAFAVPAPPPASSDAWDRLVRLDHACARFLREIGLGSDGATTRSAIAMVPVHDGQDADRRFVEDLQSLRERLSDIQDMLASFALTVAAPLAGGDPDTLQGVAARVFSPSLSVVRLHARSRRWHLGLARFHGLLASGEEDASWPALFDPAKLVHGLDAICLTTSGSLRDEGASGTGGDGMSGLNHCVGGYAARCLAGTSHVVSIGRTTGSSRVRISTAELRVGPGGTVTLHQHRARGNAVPPDHAARAVGRLLKGLADGTVPILAEATALGRPGKGTARSRTPAQVEAAIAAWDPHLPRAVPRDATELLAYLRDRV